MTDPTFLKERFRHSVSGGAVVIAIGFVLAKLFGLAARSLLLARFGASDTTDIYQAAFKLPDLIFNILVLGALSAAFIPIFVRSWDEGRGAVEAWRLTSAMLTVLTVIVGALAVVGVIFAPIIVPWLAPGFDAQKQLQTVDLTRIMLLATFFFSASNIVSGVLTALRRFVSYSLAPVLYNVGIIVGIVALEPLVGIRGLAWGVVLGSVLHLVMQLPGLSRAGFKFHWVNGWGNPGVRKTLKLMAPRTLGLAATQIEQTVSLIIASTLAAGSVTVLAAANDLQTVPMNIFGVSMAVSVFPLLSQAFHEKDTPKFVDYFSRSVRRILFFVLPATILLILLRAHLVRVIFGFGQFNWEDTILTAETLGVYSLSLFAQSLIPVLARSFYAFPDTRTPVLVSLLTVPLNIALALYFGHLWGVTGIAAAFSISSSITMIALYTILRRRVGDLNDRVVGRTAAWLTVAALTMGAVVWLLLRIIAPGVDQSTRIGLILQAGVAGVVGLSIYLAIVWFFIPQEITRIRDWVTRFFQRFPFLPFKRSA